MLISYYALTAANDSLNTEIREIMRTMDKLRNNLYDDYRPQIKMLEELQINDEITENAYPLVATKKVFLPLKCYRQCIYFFRSNGAINVHMYQCLSHIEVDTPLFPHIFSSTHLD